MLWQINQTKVQVGVSVMLLGASLCGGCPWRDFWVGGSVVVVHAVREPCPRHPRGGGRSGVRNAV